jgi:acyl-CoA synthetase (AMP-forming)/AMP-acid ligase II/thioesterase domain-containing protein/acyl carrier protein
MEKHYSRTETRVMPQYRCLGDLFSTMNQMSPSLAILAPEREPVSYGELCRQIEYTRSFLIGHGLGRNARIGVVLGDGPEMAALFLCVAAAGAFIPLSPAYTGHEYASRIAGLKVDALIVDGSFDSPACSVAQKMDLPVIDLFPLGQAGMFRLVWRSGDKAGMQRDGFACPDDIALVLETSGTTDGPKIVPLSQANIFSSAYYIGASLRLTCKDRCLNIMPMHHIAGLVSPVLASLSAGASVICTPGFSPGSFFDWIKIYRPTWYSAVPAMHQAIADQAEKSSVDTRQTSLRFVRSTTSPLFEPLFNKLERIFDRPVIQAYGLTEALPITSVPLYPYKRKPASVGVPVSEVAVLDEKGFMMQKGEREIGEIAVRGPQVFGGYENEPASSGAARSDGWFRTGDLGYVDEDGYLFLAGRVKEMINRGGQKVSPAEVEGVLMSHPSVRDAAVFGITHPRLGESVSAVVVSDGPLQERELRDYARQRLAAFKLPQHIIAVGYIPKGPTGKLMRADLAREFGHLLKRDFVSPSKKTEEVLARIWEDLLDIRQVGTEDNFFELGGDSLMMHEVLSGIEKEFGVTVPPSSLIQEPTISRLTEIINTYLPPKPVSSLVPIRPEGGGAPLFCLSHVGGDHLLYQRLSEYLDHGQPVYGIEISKEVLGSPLREAASRYVEEIRGILPHGPFALLGFSSGGLIAFEIACQLRSLNLEVPFLGILDTTLLSHSRESIKRWRLKTTINSFRNFPFWVYHYLPVWLRYYRNTAKRNLTKAVMRKPLQSSLSPGESADRIDDLMGKVIDWQRSYIPQRYHGRITFYRASAQALFSSLPDMGWGAFADEVTIEVIAGTHTSIIKEPQIAILAGKINRELLRVLRKPIIPNC